MNCICKINQHFEEEEVPLENGSEDEVTDSPSESSRANSDVQDLEQGVIKSNFCEHVGERDLPDTLKTADTLIVRTDSTHTIRNDFAYSSKLNKKQTVEGNWPITIQSEQDPKGIFKEEVESAQVTSGVGELQESSERNNELQSVVNQSVTGNRETETREKFKTVEEATIAEKHTITNGQTDAKSDEENNASDVNKRDESLARKTDHQLPGVTLNFPPPSSSRRTSDMSKIQNTFKSKNTLFQVNDDDAKDQMAPEAVDKQMKGSILLSDFSESKGGQKTVSFDI